MPHGGCVPDISKGEVTAARSQPHSRTRLALVACLVVLNVPNISRCAGRISESEVIAQIWILLLGGIGVAAVLDLWAGALWVVWLQHVSQPVHAAHA